MSDASGELVFVYGTLRRGGPEAFRMDGAVFLARGTVAGSLYRLGNGPVLVSGDETSPRVTGDLYRVSPDHLQKLDELDGLNPEAQEKSDWRRSQVLVQSSSDPEDTWIAWAWIWNGARDLGKRIRSGDWLQEYRSGFSGKLQVYPFFTLIGMTCLGCFLLCLSIGEMIGKDDSPLARIALSGPHFRSSRPCQHFGSRGVVGRRMEVYSDVSSRCLSSWLEGWRSSRSRR